MVGLGSGRGLGAGLGVQVARRAHLDACGGVGDAREEPGLAPLERGEVSERELAAEPRVVPRRLQVRLLLAHLVLGAERERRAERLRAVAVRAVAMRAAAVRAVAVRAVAVREAAARETEEMALVAERAEERAVLARVVVGGAPRDSCAA